MDVNLTKRVEDLYAKNHKMLMKKIKDLNKRRVMFMDWKTTH